MPSFTNHQTPLNQKESSLSNIAEELQSSGKKWGDIDTFCYKYGFYQDTAADKLIRGPESQRCFHEPHQPTLSKSNDLQIFEQHYSHYVNNDKASSDGDKEHKGFSLFSLLNSSSNLLKHDQTEFKSCNIEQASGREDGMEVGNTKLSTDQIIRLAAERFIEFASHMENMHPYSSSIEGLTVDDKLDVELVQLLLKVADKVSQKQTGEACRLFNCRKLASNTGTPVQRTVFYFAEALAKKIERETGETVSNITEEKIPWSVQGVHAMLENVKLNPKFHLIDLQIRSGLPWAIMMQALGKQDGFKIKQLKLTVTETIDKKAAETACTQLQNFAKSLDLIFSYKIIFLSDIEDLTEEQFQVESDETVVAYASFVLRTMIAKPICLERLMKIITRINPSMMVVTEAETNHNSPSFINRFIEAFFYYGAFFDSLEDCMERNDKDRMSLESEIFRHGIHNIVATEGTERVTRNAKYEVWKAFFERFGMVEAELSESSLYQAQLVFQTFPCATSCDLGNKGKGLLVGWKGTPIFTLSAWRFR